jgi:uncharacterized protein
MGRIYKAVHTEAVRLLKALDLKPHPEGGYYRETYRSGFQVATREGARDAITTIYYLLSGDMFSAFHRLRSDEIWHHYCGAPVSIDVIDPEGSHRELVVGGEGRWQAAIRAGAWFAARLRDRDTYALMGVDVAPGFDFVDFELGRRDELVTLFPQHRLLIERLTRC